MAKKNIGLTALNALLAIETYMTENGYFKMDGTEHLTITGILRRDLTPYIFDVYWEVSYPEKPLKKHSACVIFETDGNITTFNKKFK